MSKTLSRRLVECMKKGDLTVANLARWFDRPYPTVRTWVEQFRDPRGTLGQRKRFFDRLKLLEQAIRLKRLPKELSERERGPYVEGLRYELEAASISRRRAAVARLQSGNDVRG